MYGQSKEFKSKSNTGLPVNLNRGIEDGVEITRGVLPCAKLHAFSLVKLHFNTKRCQSLQSFADLTGGLASFQVANKAHTQTGRVGKSVGMSIETAPLTMLLFRV
jgi:hypothetical protein